MWLSIMTDHLNKNMQAFFKKRNTALDVDYFPLHKSLFPRTPNIIFLSHKPYYLRETLFQVTTLC